MKMNKNLIEENLNIEYERVNGQSLMTIETDKGYEEDYQIKMIVKNRLDHFLKISNASVNNKHYLKYDISKRQQFAQFYEYEKMKLEDVRLLCSNISEMVRLVDEYMLDLDFVLLDPNFIYMDVITKNLNFIYLPSLKNSNFTDNLRSVFEYVLEHFDHSMDKTSVVFLYEFYQNILSNSYDPYNLLKLYNELHDKMFIEEVKALEPDYNDTPQTTDYENAIEPEVENNSPEPKEKYRSYQDDFYDNEGFSEEGITIDTISKEEILIDDPEKEKLEVNKKVLAAGIIFTILSLIEMLSPRLIPIVIPKTLNFAFLLVGVACIYLYKKSLDSLKTKPALTKEEIPYVTREKKTNYQNKEASAAYKRKTSPVPEHSYTSPTSVNPASSSQVTPISETPTSQSPNYTSPTKTNPTSKTAFKVEDNISVDTVLLSDFVKKRHANKFKLILDGDSTGLIESVHKNMAFKNPEDVELELDKEEITLKKFPMVIGNFKEVADIFFDSKLVSRMHASIKKEGEDYIFEDLNSSNGSFLNGDRLETREKKILKDGDIITIASVSFKVEIS